MINTILFDNDGVLVDTESVFFEITRDVFASAGVCLTRSHWARAYLGQGQRSIQIVEALGLLRAKAEEIIEQRNREFQGRLLKGFDLLPGVRETLTVLRGQVRLAIVTSSSRKQLNCAHHLIDALCFFDCIITNDHCEYPKPHQEAYITALRHLGVFSSQCLAVEDSPRGVAAAQAAGIRCLLIPTELTDLEMCCSADWIEPNIMSVLRLIRSENGQTQGERKVIRDKNL